MHYLYTSTTGAYRCAGDTPESSRRIYDSVSAGGTRYVSEGSEAVCKIRQTERMEDSTGKEVAQSEMGEEKEGPEEVPDQIIEA